MKHSLYRIVVAMLLVAACAGSSQARGRASLVKNAYRCNDLDSATLAMLSIEENALIFPGSTKPVTTFEKRLESVLRSHKGHINIWHVGGSHVQADMLSHRLRCHFARLAGVNGTRGMLFPFSMAKTNYGSDHRLSYTGNWSVSRNISADPSLPLGITGISASTTDRSATVKLNLDNNRTPVWKYDAMRVLAQCDAQDSITISVTDKNGKTWDCQPEGDGSYIVRGLPRGTTATITIDNPTGAKFILQGIEPISSEEGSINYYSSGINGASTLSWLRCEQLDADLKRMKPDMVIFGIGINDAAVSTSKFEQETFESRYRRIIDKVLKANPNAFLLFITNNDTYCQGQPNANALTVRNAFVNLARKYGGCVWDCFGVMGGLGSSTKWRNAGMMAKDRIHFSRKGYELLADLMFESIISDFVDNDE